jgi:hypothetical protein
MSRTVKVILIVLGLLVVVLLVPMFRGKVTEPEARQLAEDRFFKLCAASKFDQNSYNGPVVTAVAGFPYEFEWTKKPGETGDGILITVEESGVINVSSVPKWASNARPERK